MALVGGLWDVDCLKPKRYKAVTNVKGKTSKKHKVQSKQKYKMIYKHDLSNWHLMFNGAYIFRVTMVYLHELYQRIGSINYNSLFVLYTTETFFCCCKTCDQN